MKANENWRGGRGRTDSDGVIPDVIRRSVARDLKSGLSHGQIAKQNGVSTSTVQWIKQVTELPPLMKQRICDLAAAGVTEPEIGQQFGLMTRIVSAVVREA